MAELEKDPSYQNFLEDSKQRESLNRENYRGEAADLLAELAQVGFDVESIGELRQRRIRYDEAIPVLVKWLPRVTDRYVKDDLVRTLSVPWARPEAVKPLIAEFRRVADHEEIGLRWAIGNALEVLADDSVFDEIVDIATDRRYGKSREMVVLALGKMKTPNASEVLVNLLDDDEVAGYAVMGLGKLRVRAARPRIELFLHHPQAWVRKEAKKALTRIDKAAGS